MRCELTKEQFKKLVKSKVIDYWQTQLRKEAEVLPSLPYFFTNFMSLTKLCGGQQDLPQLKYQWQLYKLGCYLEDTVQSSFAHTGQAMLLVHVCCLNLVHPLKIFTISY